MSCLVLLLRVLHRLRALSEQTPLDAATFSYAFPLLQQVLMQGGIDYPDEEQALEQVSLAVDIIKFHCGECTSVLRVAIMLYISIVIALI